MNRLAFHIVAISLLGFMSMNPAGAATAAERMSIGPVVGIDGWIGPGPAQVPAIVVAQAAGAKGKKGMTGMMEDDRPAPTKKSTATSKTGSPSATAPSKAIVDPSFTTKSTATSKKGSPGATAPSKAIIEPQFTTKKPTGK